VPDPYRWLEDDNSPETARWVEAENRITFGYLEKIFVQIGDSVRQGQVIAQIDRAEFLQKVKEVEAKVAQARAQYAELEAGTRAEGSS
jgi:multidrug efflux pump subunit AcrA (membrane-fusion protein)